MDYIKRRQTSEMRLHNRHFARARLSMYFRRFKDPRGRIRDALTTSARICDR
jgi:hypothetical protein